MKLRSPSSSEPERQAHARSLLSSHAWPPEARVALARLRDGGHQAVLVGGTVRDVLLQRDAHGVLDVATDLRPEDVMRRFDRVEPIGIAHGTVMILGDSVRIECTTFRREGAYADARHPENVTFTNDLAEDLARRDLTVNAMAWDPESAALSDPFGGLEDLEARVLRAVGDPVERFREDGLRPIRVARLAATLEMSLEPSTRAALGAVKDRVARVASERVRSELDRLMEAGRPSVGFELLRGSGLLELWMPELAACAFVPQNRYHEHDVYWHSLLTCDAAPVEKPEVRWAALLHDIGKPATRSEPGPDATFYGHADVGADLAIQLLDRLRFPHERRDHIVHLVRQHMFEYRSEWSDAALRRWLRRVGIDSVADLFDLRIADVVANPRHAGLPAYLEEMRVRIENLLAQSPALGVRDLAIDGDDVMRALDIRPGPAVGAVLAALLDEVTERPEHNEREWLLAQVRAGGIPARSDARKA
ncbi:MAG TPA: HD domain-containing protein [Candidatus Udaeobacter sp.]|nr:HD domain-containing protein [Candidatus Udaeobacter sp.]